MGASFFVAAGMAAGVEEALEEAAEEEGWGEDSELDHRFHRFWDRNFTDLKEDADF